MTTQRGQAVVEALAALMLLGAAGAIIASAAATSLRATQHAAVVHRLVAVGARELAMLQLGDARPEASEQPLSEPGLPGATVSRIVSTSGDDLADLSVSVTAGRPQRSVLLRTRVLAIK